MCYTISLDKELKAGVASEAENAFILGTPFTWAYNTYTAQKNHVDRHKNRFAKRLADDDIETTLE